MTTVAPTFAKSGIKMSNIEKISSSILHTSHHTTFLKWGRRILTEAKIFHTSSLAIDDLFRLLAADTVAVALLGFAVGGRLCGSWISPTSRVLRSLIFEASERSRGCLQPQVFCAGFDVSTIQSSPDIRTHRLISQDLNLGSITSKITYWISALPPAR